MLVPQELSLLVSSDPSNGAVNRTADGSSFEIQLQDGLQIPKDALSVNVSVEESTVWWTIPNILTGINDKLYITGPLGQTDRTKEDLGFPDTCTYSIELLTAPNQYRLSIQDLSGGLPFATLQTDDIFKCGEGVNLNVEFTITGVITDGSFTKTYYINGVPNDEDTDNLNSWTRIRLNGDTTSFTITIPKGLYDLTLLNSTIARELELAGATVEPYPLITLSPDEATQRVVMRFNYPDVSVNFIPTDTPREILGFNSATYGPYINAPIPLLAPNTAAFNQVNYFLIHSDLTNTGIRFNNNFNQTIAQVVIDVSPGSQIVSHPFNPARTMTQELAGAKRNNIRMWLTDDQDRRVDTNGEYWSARVVIRYYKPFIIQ
jgi:hypothetical protein